jgi:hypothetical protein
VIVAVFVEVVVGVGADINVLQLTILLMLKIITSNMKKLGAGFDVIIIRILF